MVVAAAIGAAAASWQVAHRMSPLVRRWRPSALPHSYAGPLGLRDSGPTHRSADVVVLLHGLGATGDYFGAFYDELRHDHRVLIVDLLGFGRSLDEQRASFGLADHVDALDAMLGELKLVPADVVLAAHSMSAAIALAWAARHPERTNHVYLWGPPIYADADAAAAIGEEYGTMSRLLLLDTTWAEWACRVNCWNRSASGALMAAMSPRWPTGISRHASRHTWEAYSGSLRSLVFDVDWHALLPTNVPLTIWRGTDDPSGDRDLTARLVGPARVVDIHGGDHHLALRRPDLLMAELGAGPPN